VALSQKHRSSIYSSLAPVIGEEEVDALLSQFPASESDEPSTRADLVVVRSDLSLLAAELRTEMADLRADMAERFRQQTVWMVSALFGGLTVGMGVAVAVASGLS